jgi:hypothetical protein
MGYVLSVTHKSNREPAAPVVDRDTWTHWNMTPTFPEEIAGPASQARADTRSTSSYAALAIVAAIAIAVWAFFTMWHLLPLRRERKRAPAPVKASAPVIEAEVPASESPSAS